MKRSPIKRKTRLLSKTRPRRKKRGAREFARIYGSKARVAWVRGQPCCICGGHPCENAHTVTGGMGYREANMGTRADFYVGRGEAAEWLGSIAWDGYPLGVEGAVLKANDEQEYRRAVRAFFESRDDVTLPGMGWPWPWEDSRTTDYAYAFDGDRVWCSCFGDAWFKADEDEPEHPGRNAAVFPNMRTDRHAPAGDDRSGVIVFTSKPR